jgi:hypothetical protein
VALLRNLFGPVSGLKRGWFGNTNCEGGNGRATL